MMPVIGGPMSDLLAARFQMAFSLAFHIIFAMVGIAMPLLMVIAEWLHRKTGQGVYLNLAKRWAKGTAIMFAVGAVSGTVLSFELGLLWPEFMAFAGPIIGLPFAMEGFAFFLEAIFLGLYLYGRDKISPGMHLFSCVMVLICGTLSGVFVVTANAWMNTPQGFEIGVDGMPIAIEPIKAMLNPAAAAQTLHMTVAAFQSIAFMVAGIHAWALLKGEARDFHLAAFKVVMPVLVVTALLQPLVGDYSAKVVAETQPVKLAALEAQWETETGAPLRIGGWPDEEREETRYALEIPYLLSFLAYGDFNAEVKGLKEYPVEDRPPVAVVHISFQVMIIAGSLMMLIALVAVFFRWRDKEWPTRTWFLKSLVLAAPLGIIATEAGWIVTEVGRQPWIIHGIMRTSEAVTPMPGVWLSLTVYLLLYSGLAWVVTLLMKRQVFKSLEEEG